MLRDKILSFTLAYTIFIVGLLIGLVLMKVQLEHELTALRAQAEKTHCAGEITYPEMVGESK
jgi:hypothetical protein